MTTQTLQGHHATLSATRQLPRTPRGRALYTVDWFTNGAVRLHNHDNPQLKLPGSHAR